MQIKQVSETLPRRRSDVSILKMPTLLAIQDESVDGYVLNMHSDTFLRSEVGIALWAEHNGSIHRVEGNVQAKILQTPEGPVVEILEEVDGEMRQRFCVRCIDLLGLGPIPGVCGSGSEYRDILSSARATRIMH